MNLAAIFALLLHAGVCAQTEFQRSDGSALAILVCPIMAAPGTAAPDDDATPDAPPPAPSSNT
jgi:hypothetical protein